MTAMEVVAVAALVVVAGLTAWVAVLVAPYIAALRNVADFLAAIGKGGYRAAGWVGTQVRRALVRWQTRASARAREEDEHYDGIHAITLTPPAEDLADPPTAIIPTVWPARDRALARWEQVKAQHQVRMDEARARGIRLLADRGPVTQEFARIVERDTGRALADVGPAEWTQADLFEVK